MSLDPAPGRPPPPAGQGRSISPGAVPVVFESPSRVARLAVGSDGEGVALRCILHLGMPKAGSSSIQESLFHGLRAPGFRYLSLGEVSGYRILMAAFDPEARDGDALCRGNLDDEGVSRLRIRCLSELGRRVERASRRGQTLVLSSEGGWSMRQDGLAALRDFILERGYAIEVLVYLRAAKGYLESEFQEQVKQVGGRFDDFLGAFRGFVDYATRLSILDEVFGCARVEAAPFQPARFPGGCVVRDFCARTRIPIPEGRIRRTNEGLSLPALKLLFAQRQFGRGYGTGLANVVRNEILFRRLAEVKGPPVRFRSSLFGPLIADLGPTFAEVERRIGASLREGLGDDRDDREAVGAESELREFTSESLEWLARATGLPRVRETAGVEAAKAVAGQMQHLLDRPSLSSRLRWHRMIAERRVARLLRDV